MRLSYTSLYYTTWHKDRPCMVLESTQSSLDNSYGDVARTHDNMSNSLSASAVTDERIIHRPPACTIYAGDATLAEGEWYHSG